MHRPRPHRRLALAGLSVALSTICLVAVAQVRLVDGAALWRTAQGLALPWLLPAVLIGVGTQVLAGPDRFRWLLAATGHRLPYRTLLAMRLGGGPLRLLTPLKAGGLADLAFLQRRHGVPGALSAGCLAYDRLLNLLGLVVWLHLGLLLRGRPGAPELLLGLGAVAAGLALCLLHPAVASLAAGLARRLHPKLGRLAALGLAPVARTSGAQRAALLAYALVYQCSPWLTGWLLCRSAGLPLGLGDALVGVNSAMLAAQLPGPLAGIGPREATLVYTLGELGPAEVLLAVGLLLSALISVLPLLVGLPWTGWYLAQVVAPDPPAPAVEPTPPQA